MNAMLLIALACALLAAVAIGWALRERLRAATAEARIGMLEKDFTRSLLRSHWHVRDAAGVEILEAHESSWIISLVRRSMR